MFNLQKNKKLWQKTNGAPSNSLVKKSQQPMKPRKMKKALWWFHAQKARFMELAPFHSCQKVGNKIPKTS